MEDIEVHAKILEVFHDEGSVLVRFFTDYLSEEALKLDPSDTSTRPDGSPVRCRTDVHVNIWNPDMTEAEVEAYLMSQVNIEWFRLQKKLLDPEANTCLAQCESLMQKGVFSKVFSPPATLNSQVSEADIDAMIADLVNPPA